MARLWTSGGEWKDGTAEGVTGGTFPLFATSPVRSGTYSMQHTGASASNVAITNVLGRGYYARAYANFAAFGDTATAILYNDTSRYKAVLNADGTLNLQFDTSVIGSASSALLLDTWYRIELFFNIGAGSGDDSAELRVDGVTVASEANQTRGTSVANNIGFGNSDAAATFNAFFDDCALNDDQGASQNSWPGSGSVVLLRPTADSVVGTGWTLGNTTATGGNAWQREDNIPPDSATDLTANANAMQIRNATSNANVNYDATMMTYTAAGVTGTVNVVVPIIATGAPVTTSAKQGTVGVVSNPAITNVALGAGGTSGAFWSGVAMGTYPTGNKWSFGTTTYAPTVTLGTAPVMRVTQVTSSTRIAIVTEMGIYVDYTPAVTTLPPLPVYVDSAVARSTNY